MENSGKNPFLVQFHNSQSQYLVEHVNNSQCLICDTSKLEENSSLEWSVYKDPKASGCRLAHSSHRTPPRTRTMPSVVESTMSGTCGVKIGLISKYMEKYPMTHADEILKYSPHSLFNRGLLVIKTGKGSPLENFSEQISIYK